MKKKRIDFWIPVNILEKIDEYADQNGIPTRTAALIELIRKGLGKK
jgi:metal-responsive CopG/Arc/MetJ family transcriptional regulator